jgi:uncharacterized protein (TIGR02266 family)
MTQQVEQGQIAEQVARARGALGSALGQLQDVNVRGLDTARVSAALAQAIKSLFTAEQTGLADAVPVESAMEHLRGTLMLLQDLQVNQVDLNQATATIARTLAILYPVASTLRTQMPAPSPIPLVARVAPSLAPPQPVPLVARRSGPPSTVPPEVEKRTAPRRALEVELGFQSDTNFFTGFTQDISGGGIFVATYDIPAVGTKVNVNFLLPGGPMMSIDGVVRWVREYNDNSPDTAPGIGVSFERIHPQDQAAINAYLRENAPLFFEE